MRNGEQIRSALVKFAEHWQGYSGTIAQDKDEISRRLMALNAEIVAGQRPYDPFAGRDGQSIAQQLGLPVA
ncbi:hypothetical protein [Micromonospora marina]|uniref:hypothetical protein n=1 Tax=Micromonospora marina TaxID=307120 RepID=UPI003D7046A3